MRVTRQTTHDVSPVVSCDVKLVWLLVGVYQSNLYLLQYHTWGFHTRAKFSGWGLDTVKPGFGFSSSVDSVPTGPVVNSHELLKFPCDLSGNPV